jgi:hypothetical protein
VATHVISLDPTLVLFTETESHRPVVYIGLSPLLGSVVFADMEQYNTNPDVVRFVSHLGGHARSFERLRTLLVQRRDKPTYDDLFSEFKKFLVFDDPSSLNLPVKLIVDCLLGRKVNMADLAGNSKLVSYYVQQVCKPENVTLVYFMCMISFHCFLFPPSGANSAIRRCLSFNGSA